MNWKLYFKFLKDKGNEKFKSIDKFNESFSIHFKEIKKLLEKNVRKSSGIMVLYKEIERIESILLNDKGYVHEKYRSIMLSYIDIFDTLKESIPNELNYNLSKELYNKLVEIMFYLSEDIANLSKNDSSKSDVSNSSLASIKEASSLNKLDKNLEKIKLIKNKSERENQLYDWLMNDSGPSLSPTGVVNKSVEDALSELKEMKKGNFINPVTSDAELSDLSSQIFTDVSKDVSSESSESSDDIIVVLENKLANENLSSYERRKIESNLKQAKDFRELIENKLNE